MIRRAGADDAARLSAFAAATFRDTFGADNTPEDMARYLTETYSPEIQAAEIAEPAAIVLLAEQPGLTGAAELVGYAHLIRGAAPDAVTGPDPMELKRLYVGQAWHGRGIAAALMAAALGAARQAGARTLWLGVWERNPRAVAFYAKHGFQRVGEHTFRLGTDLQTDWLLARVV